MKREPAGFHITPQCSHKDIDIAFEAEAQYGNLSPDQKYAFQERLGILEVPQGVQPTATQVAIAWRQVTDITWKT